jgi:hypothetical protein
MGRLTTVIVRLTAVMFHLTSVRLRLIAVRLELTEVMLCVTAVMLALIAVSLDVIGVANYPTAVILSGAVVMLVRAAVSRLLPPDRHQWVDPHLSPLSPSGREGPGE